MVWRKLRIIFAAAFFVYGIPGMFSDWEVWRSWLSEWAWWNVVMVAAGSIWLVKELVSLSIRFSKDFDARGGLRSFLHHQISGSVEFRVWHFLLALLLIPFVPAIMALALVVFHYGSTIAFDTANFILEFFGLSSTIYPEQGDGQSMVE